MYDLYTTIKHILNDVYSNVFLLCLNKLSIKS